VFNVFPFVTRCALDIICGTFDHVFWPISFTHPESNACFRNCNGQTNQRSTSSWFWLCKGCLPNIRADSASSTQTMVASQLHLVLYHQRTRRKQVPSNPP
jgi:hypothetical protein